MQTKGFVVAIALVLALAAATPVIGATANRGAVADQALQIGKEAREMAKTAKRAANKARGTAKAALDVANSALTAATTAANKADAATTTAAGAATKADAVAAELGASKTSSASANGIVTTANETDYQNLGGPSVTVTVPASGLIEVWAQVEAEEGAIALFEDGVQVPDLDPNGACDGPGGALLSVPGSPSAIVATPASGFVLCGQPGPPGPVLIRSTAGEHTFSLRYADCGCDPGIDGTFSDRFLAVAPRP